MYRCIACHTPGQNMICPACQETYNGETLNEPEDKDGPF